MSYNGSGTFLINTAGQPVVSGTVISSTAFNALTADLATGLSTAITKDGQTTVTANIPMSTYKFTGLGVGSAATDSANLSQVQSTVTKLLNSVSGADTITATASPTLAAYAAGQMFYFVAAGDNTTSVTLNIDSLGAKAVTRDGATALAAADIKSGEVVVVVYDGTRFQVVSQLNSAGDARFANVSIASSLYVGGVSTFVGNAGFSANVSIASALSVGGVAAITGATTIGGNLTLSGGTANGVLYLNGSKVATSGSGLYTDGSRLGIGTVSFPAGQRLRVAGGDVGFEGQYFYLLNADANIQMGAAQNAQIINSDTGNLLTFSRTGASSAMAFSTAGSEAMRITNAQNVGIGTASPAYKLDVNGNAQVGNATAATNRFLYINGVANKAGAVAFQESGVNRWLIGNGAASENGNFEIYDATNGNNFVMTRTGNLGLGVTPGAWAASRKAVQLGGSVGVFAGPGITQVSSNVVFDGTSKYIANGFAALYGMDSSEHRWYTAPSGTAGNAISFTQAMTLDASGRLFVGSTTGVGNERCLIATDSSGTYSQCLNLKDTNASASSNNFLVVRKSDDTYLGVLKRSGTDNAMAIDGNAYLAFQTGATERARITSGGDMVVGSSTSAGRFLSSSGNNDKILTGFSTITSGYTDAIVVSEFRAYAPNNATARFLYCGDTVNERAVIRSNGGLANYQANDVNLSDERVKTDIKPLGSMWDKFKAIEIVTFKYKDQTHDDDNIGVIAQQVESVAPEFIDVDGFGETPEDGVPLKTVYTTDMYHAAIKALQEAMSRIEQLEAKVAALEAK